MNNLDRFAFLTTSYEISDFPLFEKTKDENLNKKWIILQDGNPCTYDELLRRVMTLSLEDMYTTMYLHINSENALIICKDISRPWRFELFKALYKYLLLFLAVYYYHCYWYTYISVLIWREQLITSTTGKFRIGDSHFSNLFISWCDWYLFDRLISWSDTASNR